ncbi:hypothetical protein [Chthonobacter albigriseus]|uniref:PIN-like domain-containing protein n=1 Tax=Chthonobacter albigriseus TaxID=1683161 RepID=UPI0015EF52A6|nr:hypothetical protein [Chthonobacter albigriseus]
MKIKFDENISPKIVEAIRNLETDSSIEISTVREDYGQGIEDPDWIFRFKSEGGTAMISGDHNILQDPVNLKSYTESGLISFWPPRGFPELKKFGQAALLIRWWTVIKEKARQSTPGSRWRIPQTGLWSPGADRFEQIRDPRIDKADDN